MENYYFKDNTFIIKNYDQQKPFSSFLPAIAGEKGIPLWCYYVNRGQGVASFGIRDKNGCILEFYPANTAYRIIDKMGFRTFIKKNGKVQEIFSPNNLGPERTMYINQSQFQVEEINKDLNVRILVTYFGLPNENVGGLVRTVEIENLDDSPFEIIDGITQLIPSGIDEWSLKHQSNLRKSWMDVEVLKSKTAFYKLNSAPGDEAEVKDIESGHYYVSFIENHLEDVVYDINVIFGNDTTLSLPLNFYKSSVNELLRQEQVSANKVPCGFTLKSLNLKCHQKTTINTIIGYTHTKMMIEAKIDKFLSKDYIKIKQQEADMVIEDLTKEVYTKSNHPIFDSYMKQNYLDNILRGGYPKVIHSENKDFIYHLFSRRHGDLEREYNFFSIAPEYYSQGNGNFRDVCQNRRSDVLFHKEVEMFNAKMFAELIQLDGYNPLGVLGSVFYLNDEKAPKKLSRELFSDHQDIMENVLSNKFTPGMIMNTMEQHKITSKCNDNELLSRIFTYATQETNADFGEGYWSDHWTYILDLIENTLNVFPDRKDEYFFNDGTYKFYDSPVTVLPRDEKYVLTPTGEVHQYGALLEKDLEKIERLSMNVNGSNWVKNAQGEAIHTNLFGKMFTLVINKFASLDSIGVGIEMDGNKPGWNDAMNGLPGLFGSGVSEAIELARIVKVLKTLPTDKTTSLPVELLNLVNNVYDVYSTNSEQFKIWDEVSTHKETFRSQVRFGVSKMKEVSVKELLPILELMEKVLNKGLDKAIEIGNGIYPSYIVFEATKYLPLNKIGNYGLPTVKVLEFKARTIPHFLEAPARSMKYITDHKLLQSMHQKIKASDIYDSKLQMYKTSEALDEEGYDIGRIRAFQKGWLERESNFLHMTYKYLLGLLKGGLYDEFYQEIKTNFVCFMDPNRYGRSTLENSSFIAPSNNPDKDVWGQGFVSRLSGSTAEMLSIWNIMMFGEHPFTYDDELCFQLMPKLSSDFFTEDGQLEALFMSNVLVCYHNEKHQDTNKLAVQKYVLTTNDKTIEVKEQQVKGELALQIRNNQISKIDVYLK